MRGSCACLLVLFACGSDPAPTPPDGPPLPPIEGRDGAYWGLAPRYAVAVGTYVDFQLYEIDGSAPLTLVEVATETPDLVDVMTPTPTELRVTGKAVGTAYVWVSANWEGEVYRKRMRVTVADTGVFGFDACTTAIANQRARIAFSFSTTNNLPVAGAGHYPVQIEPASAAAVDVAASDEAFFAVTVGTAAFTLRSTLGLWPQASIAIADAAQVSTAWVAVEDLHPSDRKRIHLFAQLADGTKTCTPFPAHIEIGFLQDIYCDFIEPVTGAELDSFDALDGVFIADGCGNADVTGLASFVHVVEHEVDFMPSTSSPWPFGGGGGGGGGSDWD